jgi:hypothetical protein
MEPMSKPSELYVGVLDLFAIVLPGAIATAILAPSIGPSVVGSLVPSPSTDVGFWVMYLTSAYFIGHLIFLVGSYIDRLYDPVRKRLSPHYKEGAYQCATLIKEAILCGNECKTINTFQWARSVLVARCPGAAEDIHRLEADSKFFRSVLVVCALGAAVFFFRGKAMEGGVAAILIPICFARYYERRLKSTTQAYIHLVAQYRLGNLASASSAAA